MSNSINNNINRILIVGVIVLIIVIYNLTPLFNLNNNNIHSNNNKINKNNHMQNNRYTAVLFGDSITQQGYSVAQHGYNNNIFLLLLSISYYLLLYYLLLLLYRWVSLLSEYWTRKVDIINRGYSGYNTKLGINIIKDVVLILKPNLIVLFFGANDACVENTLHHVPLNEFYDNLNKMIYLIKEELPTTTIILITPPPIYEPALELSNKNKNKEIIKDRNLLNTKKYVNEVKKLGILHKLTVVDAFNALKGNEPNDERKNYFIDGLHLNAL